MAEEQRDKGEEPKRADSAPGAVLIGDGYDLVADLQDDDGVLPPVTIWYRPALPEAVLDYRARDRDDGKKAKAALLDLLGPNITTWRGVYRRDPQGNFVPVEYSKENLGRLPQPYLDKALDYVGGYKMGRWESDVKN